jgi:hypothetical protein
MAMVSTHGAPQVTYPAGRWRFYPYLLALVWLLQLGVGIAAYAVGDRTSWPLLWTMVGWALACTWDAHCPCLVRVPSHGRGSPQKMTLIRCGSVGTGIQRRIRR